MGSWMWRNRGKMGVDAACDRATKFHRNGIADQAPQYLEAHLTAIGNERVVTREALNDCRFPQGDRAILFRMPKPAIPEPIALRRHGGGRLVPLHAAVDAGVGPAAFCAMAFGDEMLRPVAPRAARLRYLDAFEILF